jgi:hypothetical protein
MAVQYVSIAAGRRGRTSEVPTSTDDALVDERAALYPVHAAHQAVERSTLPSGLSAARLCHELNLPRSSGTPGTRMSKLGRPTLPCVGRPSSLSFLASPARDRCLGLFM